MINKQLKKQIINFIVDNDLEFQITNKTTEKFKAYIYTTDGEYLIGGEGVSKFIDEAISLVTN